MDTTKDIRCTIGRHQWQYTTSDRMGDRTCLRCGRSRYHGSRRRPDPAESDGAVDHGSGGGGGFWSGAFFSGGSDGGFDGGGDGGGDG